jgi:hypothetical protein
MQNCKEFSFFLTNIIGASQGKTLDLMRVSPIVPSTTFATHEFLEPSSYKVS